MNSPISNVRVSRRQVLVAGLTSAGGLLVGLPLAAGAQQNERRIGSFVEVRADNTVVIGSSQPELGQGIRTGLPMVLAEELDVDWKQVTVRQMPLGIVKTADGYAWKYGAQGAGGSNAMRSNYEYMRQVGAIVRHQLIRAAAQRLNVSPQDCSTESGYVSNGSTAARIPYGDLVATAAGLELPTSMPPLKAAAEYRIVGSHRKTVDAHDIVTGAARYGVDTATPGMCYAVVARAPVLNAGVLRYDDAQARAVDGVIDVVMIDGPAPGEPYTVLASGVAVVADSTWSAIQGRNNLEIEWTDSQNAGDSSDRFWQENEALLSGDGQIVLDDGDVDAAMSDAATTLTRRYRVPFVSHAPLEPQNCYASVGDDQVHIIAPTQMPGGASRTASAVTGVPRENIRVDMTRVGGAFGRRLTSDFVAEACLISKAVGRPVKLQWTREDDIQNDFYRPAGLHELRAGVAEDGKVIAWTHRLASASKYFRRPNMPDENLYSSELYLDDFPRRRVRNLRMEYFHNAIGLPRGSWRAPAHTANAFVVQSFIDELAVELGQDPLQFRLDLYGEAEDLPYEQHGGPSFNPGRLARLLRFVSDRISYGDALRPNHGVGLAAHFTFGGYAAHAIEVSVIDGVLSIERIVAAIDCGLAVHPNAVLAQLEGGTVDGLSTALGLEITVRNGRIQQSNFHDYPLARIADFPDRFESHILPWDESPVGVGEIGLPSAAPALTNAIFAACGKRIRALPIGNQLQA